MRVVCCWDLLVVPKVVGELACVVTCFLQVWCAHSHGGTFGAAMEWAMCKTSDPWGEYSPLIVVLPALHSQILIKHLIQFPSPPYVSQQERRKQATSPLYIGTVSSFMWNSHPSKTTAPKSFLSFGMWHRKHQGLPAALNQLLHLNGIQNHFCFLPPRASIIYKHLRWQKK